MSGSELKQREIQEEGMRRRREGETRRERERGLSREYQVWLEYDGDEKTNLGKD